MYIHIGEDLNIRGKDIIAVLDKESVQDSAIMGEFLLHFQEKLVNLSKNPFKSVIITDQYVYLSPIASGTIKKRFIQTNIQELL
ncbi:extracellular matrix regulator RemB [Bacillus rubiinfantis]|uniref:extracellular matrix regulator RemB n=1 Tax=Bacillus rubiinfantis TaxID=1499680 RepID=UPI0005AA1F1B|nr:extracellular matrix/biofilm biosynthesis regulator RemA family protein [Bacillus rubiinfantis]